MSAADSPTVPIRIALYAALKGDWDRCENALLQSLSDVRKQKHEQRKEAAKA